MRNRRSTTQTLDISEVQAGLSTLADAVGQGDVRVLVEEAGVPVAALVSVDDLARLARLDREWDERTKALETFGAAFQDVPTDELEERIEQIVNDERGPTAGARRSA